MTHLMYQCVSEPFAGIHNFDREHNPRSLCQKAEVATAGRFSEAAAPLYTHVSRKVTTKNILVVNSV